MSHIRARARTHAHAHTRARTHTHTRNIHLVHRMIQEEGSLFWEMAVSVTVRKVSSFEHVSNSDWLPR